MRKWSDSYHDHEDREYGRSVRQRERRIASSAYAPAYIPYTPSAPSYTPRSPTYASGGVPSHSHGREFMAPEEEEYIDAPEGFKKEEKLTHGEILEFLYEQLRILLPKHCTVGGLHKDMAKNQFKINVLGDRMLCIRFQPDQSPMSADANAFRISILDCAFENGGKETLYSFATRAELGRILYDYFNPDEARARWQAH